MDELAELLTHQSGLLSRRQALELGLTDSAINWRTSRGSWRRILPGLLATFPGSPSFEQRLVAASLHGGPGAQITACAALRRHGARYLPDEPRVDVLVPADRRRRSHQFVRIIRTSRLDDHALVRDGVELCSVARAAADAARLRYPRRDVRAFLADVVQQGLTTVDRLAAELAAGRTNGTRDFREALTELFDGVRSAPEGDLRAVLLASTALPPLVWNPRLVADDGTRLPRPDGWIDDAGVALETDSREFHADLAGWQRTMERHALFASYGILALHFSPRDIRDRPDWVRATVERTYARRAATFAGVTISNGSSCT